MKNHNPLAHILAKYENYMPKMRYDFKGDFCAWQKDASVKLHELLGLNNFEKCDFDFVEEYRRECGDYTEVKFSFNSEESYNVIGYIWLKNEDDCKRKPMICLQGHSSGLNISMGIVKYENDAAAISGGDRDFARIAIKNGYSPIMIDQRYMGECGGGEKGPGCLRTGVYSTSALPATLFGRTAIGERVWDVMRLIDVLCLYYAGELDMNNLICMGNSGGGTTTLYAACLDERIKTAIPSCALCTFADSIISHYHCPCNYIPHIAEFFDMGDLCGLVAPRRLVVVSGEHDEDFPIDGANKAYETAEKLYAAANVSENIAHIIGNEGHRFYAESTYEYLKKEEI